MRNANTVSCPIPRKDFMIDGRRWHWELSHLCTALSALTVITSECVCVCVYVWECLCVETRVIDHWCLCVPARRVDYSGKHLPVISVCDSVHVCKGDSASVSALFVHVRVCVAVETRMPAVVMWD